MILHKITIHAKGLIHSFRWFVLVSNCNGERGGVEGGLNMVGKNKIQKHPSKCKILKQTLKLPFYILNIFIFTLSSSSWSEISVNASLLKLYSRIRR